MSSKLLDLLSPDSSCVSHGVFHTDSVSSIASMRLCSLCLRDDIRAMDRSSSNCSRMHLCPQPFVSRNRDQVLVTNMGALLRHGIALPCHAIRASFRNSLVH
eukprot:5811554-Amphidinium_carterae.2